MEAEARAAAAEERAAAAEARAGAEADARDEATACQCAAEVEGRLADDARRAAEARLQLAEARARAAEGYAQHEMDGYGWGRGVPPPPRAADARPYAHSSSTIDKYV